MTGVLQLLALVVVACVATFLLERGGRLGYGWVTGSEFLIAGLLLGPVGLDVVSADLLRDADVLVVIASAWMGLRLGLRLCRSEVATATPRTLISSQVEPLVALLILRGLLELARHWTGYPGSGWSAWMLAALGATSTKSAIAWAKSLHHSEGPVSDALQTICDLDDLPSVFLVGVLFAFLPQRNPQLAMTFWAPLAATAVLACAVALLVYLVIGRTFRVDLAWVAMLGAGALVSGAALPLGLRPLVVGCLAGIFLGIISSHRDALEALTRPTERPVVQVLLLLGGASIQLIPGALLLGAAFAVLRLAAKALGGAFVGTALRPTGRAEPRLGLGLFAGGGMAFALALSASLALPREVAAPLLSSVGAMVLMGDLVGAPVLKWMLKRAGEIPAATEARDASDGVSS